MRAWLLRRLGVAVLTILLATVLVFFATRALPGDPALVLLGQSGGRLTPEQYQEARERFGLNESVVVQYGHYLKALAGGDLGTSAQTDLPVGPTILDRLPVTIELAVLSLAFALVVGVASGVVASLRPHRWPDYTVNAVGLLGISIPNFWLGIVLILVFAVNLGWFPASGFVPLLDDPLINLQRMVLPVLTLGTAFSAVMMRQMRSAMIEALQSDYVRTARSKGLRRGQIIIGHALRNCRIPLLTITGLQLGALISGAVVAEQLFVLPGLGKMLLEGVTNRDYAVVQAVALVMAVGYVLINLLVDLAYARVDPRIRRPGSAS
jgi:peptide/nickel transport system permease protein